MVADRLSHCLYIKTKPRATNNAIVVKIAATTNKNINCIKNVISISYVYAPSDCWRGVFL